jgi:hypothetical protein
MSVERVETNIELIDYDKTNPRIAHVLEEFGEEPTPDEISRALKEESSDILRRSIKQSNGIENPIKVIPSEGGRFVVFEGNTRLSIYRKFLATDEAGDWSQIPTLVYQGLEEKNIDYIRIQDHLVGTHPWSAYAKAKYLHDLHMNKKIAVQEIASLCGIQQSSILNSIETYVFMNRSYRKVVEDEELEGPRPDPYFNDRQYSAFEVYTSRTRIQEAVYDAGYSEDDFSRWVASGLFTRQEDVRDLDQILEKPEAVELFLKYGSREAYKVVDKPGLNKQLREASLTTLCAAVVEKVQSISHPEIESIRSDSNAQMQLRDAQFDIDSFLEAYTKTD